jgi:hypothetical protein
MGVFDIDLKESFNALVTRIFPVLSWIFWICVGIVVVIMLIQALNKRWAFLASSLPALLVSLVVGNVLAALVQGILLPLGQPSQWPAGPSHVMKQPGQVITDDKSDLALTYLSARKTTDASDGLIYITVHMRMTNTSPSQSAFLYSATFFVKDTHTKHSEDAINPEGRVPGYHGNSLLSEKNNPIEPGATIEGDVAFSCFPDQNPDQFAWDPNFNAGQQGVQIYVWNLTFQ